MDDKTVNRIVFPENILFEDVSSYDSKINGKNESKHLIFDLSNTVNFHSSFIGFLIHTKFVTKKNNIRLSLLLSFTAERLLALLNILEYFEPEIEVLIKRKSA